MQKKGQFHERRSGKYSAAPLIFFFPYAYEHELLCYNRRHTECRLAMLERRFTSVLKLIGSPLHFNKYMFLIPPSPQRTNHLDWQGKSSGFAVQSKILNDRM